MLDENGGGWKSIIMKEVGKPGLGASLWCIEAIICGLPNGTPIVLLHAQVYPEWDPASGTQLHQIISQVLDTAGKAQQLLDLRFMLHSCTGTTSTCFCLTVAQHGIVIQVSSPAPAGTNGKMENGSVSSAADSLVSQW